MVILDKRKQRRIHQRSIDVAIYEGSSATIVVEGSLKDDRFLDSHLPDGSVQPPFTVHHMIIRMALTVPDLRINDIEVAMPAAPHADCHGAQQVLEALKGMRIAAGFTARVRNAVDRRKGCTHLLTLLTAMAPAAFQGAWSARVSRPIDPQSYAAMAASLVDTCLAWRGDGPLANRRLNRS